jgi:hypothetical protein
LKVAGAIVGYVAEHAALEAESCGIARPVVEAYYTARIIVCRGRADFGPHRVIVGRATGLVQSADTYACPINASRVEWSSKRPSDYGAGPFEWPWGSRREAEKANGLSRRFVWEKLLNARTACGTMRVRYTRRAGVRRTPRRRRRTARLRPTIANKPAARREPTRSRGSSARLHPRTLHALIRIRAHIANRIPTRLPRTIGVHGARFAHVVHAIGGRIAIAVVVSDALHALIRRLRRIAHAFAGDAAALRAVLALRTNPIRITKRRRCGRALAGR